MESRLREFLRQISGVTALAASGSLLGRETRFPACSVAGKTSFQK